MIPGGGSRIPPSDKSLKERQHYIKMEGREVFKHAVTNMASAALDLLKKNGLTIEDVGCVIPHQANARIIQAVGQKLGAAENQVFINVDKYGNTSAASIIVALHEAIQAGRVRKGDVVMLVAFGAGFTWGATLLEI
jgi:3-oxoacyl-[acyl-carrier-protein] synthase-3